MYPDPQTMRQHAITFTWVEFGIVGYKADIVRTRARGNTITTSDGQYLYLEVLDGPKHQAYMVMTPKQLEPEDDEPKGVGTYMANATFNKWLTARMKEANLLRELNGRI